MCYRDTLLPLMKHIAMHILCTYMCYYSDMYMLFLAFLRYVVITACGPLKFDQTGFFLVILAGKIMTILLGYY